MSVGQRYANSLNSRLARYFVLGDAGWLELPLAAYADVGLRVHSGSHLTLSNSTIEGYDIGIYVESGGSINVSNVTIVGAIIPVYLEAEATVSGSSITRVEYL